MPRLTKNVLLKLALAGGVMLAFLRCAHATDIAYTGVFQGTEGPAKVTGNTASNTYTRDMNTTGDRVSMEIVTSSTTGMTAKTFTDGSTSTGTITVSSNTFIQASTPTIKINGITVPYIPGTTAGLTAIAISSAINNTASLSAILVSTADYGQALAFSTSTSVGISANYTMTSSSNGALGVPPAMAGGTNSAYTINTPTITIATNGFTTGVQVLYAKAAGLDISGLTDKTTYYVSIINPNQTTGAGNAFKLSTTLANAVAGSGITLASSATKTTADTFTLTPLGFTNTNQAGIQLQWSDDNVTYFNATTGNYGLAITSVTFAAAGATALWDLGPIQHRYLRLNEIPPTTGAINYTATDNERYSFKH